jgi:hypothetical protein
MSAHTPGPWTVEHKDHGARQFIKSRKGAVAILQNYGSAEAMAAAPLTVERIANARLIAAAPDLLAALVSLQDEVQRMRAISHYFFDQCDQRPINAARAAIAKATE